MFQRACYCLFFFPEEMLLLIHFYSHQLTYTPSLASCLSVLILLLDWSFAYSFQFLVWQSLFLFTVSPVTGMIGSCEAVQTKALLQLDFSSSRVECFQSLPSPPPIRRASLPLSLSFSPYGHIVPLMLDAPNSECSLSGQENSSKEAFAYSIQNQG